MNIQNLVLDINKKPFQTITANVGEVASRFVRINIVDKSIPMDLTGVTASLYAEKPDGKKVFNNVTIEDKKNGIILAELTSQILAIEGLVKLTLLLVKNGGKLCSKQFLLNVDSSIVDDEAIESTNEFTALVDALGRVNNIDRRFENVSSQLAQKASKNDLEIQAKRIDSFTSLEQGSTTGDAELIDARVGADGVVYESLGTGIRTQFESVNNNLNKIFLDGANLFDSSVYDDSSNLGITINYDKNNGYLILNGTCNGVAAFWKDFIFTATDDITVSVRYISGSISGNGIQFDLYNNESVGTYIGTLTSSFCFPGSVLSKSLNNINLKQSRIYVRNGTVCDNLVIAIQVEKGTSVSDFQKYGEKSLNVVTKEEFSNHTEKNSNFITDAKQDLGYFNKGGVVICVDDGTEHDKPIAWELVKSYNVPFVFALMQDSYVVKNQLDELKTIVSNYNCEVALHGSDTMSDWPINKVNDFYLAEISKFKEQGIVITNFVAPQNETSVNMRHVGQNYFNMMFSEFPNKNGVTIENKNRTNRYMLSRTAVTLGYGTGYYFPRMLQTKTEPVLFVMYFHSVTMAKNEPYLQLMKDIIQYAKENEIEITTFENFYKNN